MPSTARRALKDVAKILHEAGWDEEPRRVAPPSSPRKADSGRAYHVDLPDSMTGETPPAPEPAKGEARPSLEDIP